MPSAAGADPIRADIFIFSNLQSPWLKDYVQAAATAPLPLIPKKLEEFPSRWPFPRGDLYHWIPLLNRFDSILQSVCETYELQDDWQKRDFGCLLLLGSSAPVDYGDASPWDQARISQLGYGKDGDRDLILAVLRFTQMLLEKCGNRSIYASSPHLNGLLFSPDLTVNLATAAVLLELAQRYQASVKRMSTPSRQVSSALLANHYNVDLERVQCLAQPFAKTPLVRLPDAAPVTPSASVSKGKDKEKPQATTPKNVASMYANDLVAIAAPGQADEGRWNGWGDVKFPYYPKVDSTEVPPTEPSAGDRGSSSVPSTPTPLRRSSTAITQTPRSTRASGSDDSPAQRTPGPNGDTHVSSGPKYVEIRQSTVQSTSIYDLLKLCPADMPKNARYAFFHRLRVCKALMGSVEDRQRALAVRLLAITNLAYIHPEPSFIEKALKQDNDEPRRYQLVYQLAELIHPSTDGVKDIPNWLQAIAMSLLEAILSFQSKYSDVLSALNANVNHGVLLYVIRKAVAEMKEDPPNDVEGQVTEEDRWRESLFSLTLHMAMLSRIGQDMSSAGLMEILVEMLNLRSKIASRSYPMVLNFLDSLTYTHQGTFQLLTNASGLDAIANLIVHTVSLSKTLTASGQGTKPAFHASLVDYDIPYYEQQTLKWLLKFIHHVMSNTFAVWGNTDRLLRNLVDNSALLGSLRAIIQDMRLFGSVVWTNAVTLLSDFINNDPTSFAAISESGMIQTFLEALTGRPVVAEQPAATPAPEARDDEEPTSPSYSEDSVTFESDSRPHPPTQEMLDQPRDWPLAHGILPSAEAISAIPSVLNSISLNNQGMKMVVSSRVFESFLEIFESPDHVHCLELDMELAGGIGGSFDELARHHPALRPSLSNAVIDMVARVVRLAKTKSITAGWGASLQITDPTGNAVTADRSLLQKIAPGADGKGKEKATAADSDVEMTDVNLPTVAAVDSIPRIGPQTGAGITKPYKEITPYIQALTTFLTPIVTTPTLKSPFVKSGGIELLLDLMEAPSLKDNFGNTTASRTLSQVAAQLIDSNQILGLPSLLNRVQSHLDVLRPLMDSEGPDPFFRPFLVADVPLRDLNGDWDLALVCKVSEGTHVVKSLISLETLIRTLYQCFPVSRQNILSLPLVNVYDYYTQLISGLGPLLRKILTEEMAVASFVPAHWARRTPPESGSDVVAAPPSADDDPAVADALSASWHSGDQGPVAPAKSLSDEEQTTVRYRNFETLRGLLHGFLPSALPFFQNLGKALLSRRTTDPYIRNHHFALAKSLAEIILELLKPPPKESKMGDFHYWIIMFHTVHEMLVDSSRQTDRHSVPLIIPVLVAFKELGGFEVLNALLLKFADEVAKGPGPSEPDSRARLELRLSAVGMKKILEIYAVIVDGKNVADSLGQTSLTARPGDRGKEYASQLVVELRMAILPVVRRLWEYEELIERATPEVLTKTIDILKTVAAADYESDAYRKSDKAFAAPLFKNRESKPSFDWSSSAFQDQIKNLNHIYNDEDLVREAVYRAMGKSDDASDYCRAHQQGTAGKRNPIPETEAYQGPSLPEVGGRDQAAARAQQAPSQLPSLDSASVDNILSEVLGQQPMDDFQHSSDDESYDNDDDSHETSSQHSAGRETDGPANPEGEVPPPITKDDLDAEREKLHEEMIDRSLDVIRAHPGSVFDVSKLIIGTVLKSDSEDKRTEVGEVLANALMSFAVNDEEERKTSGQSIAAYAHLLCLLLKENDAFFRSAVPTLKPNISEYLGFLKLPPASSNEELPPWIPYVLLLFELLLADDARPLECKWKAPTGEDDASEMPTLVPRESHLSDEERSVLLTTILEMLPRIGKETPLAVSTLRILVILTRDYSVAKVVGEKRNLQRLFVMAKQLCSAGSARLKQSHISDSIMIILRHVVEDEQTIRQVMEAEIRQYMSKNRGPDIATYLRYLSHVALRSPEAFVEVTLKTVQLARWSASTVDGPPRPHMLILKERPVETGDAPKDSSIEPAVQATEGLTISDVKPSTETDKEMADVMKTPVQEHKRPVLENPDGVVHFLLCELLNYREVDDKEPSTTTPKDNTATAEPAETPVDAESSNVEDPSLESKEKEKEKDKKSSKPVFKAEDHHIFVYRCFLLNCLAELLQSFNRAKVEFINFKRSAPVQTNTPIKPRSSVLNYLLNDLLCLSHTMATMDSVSIKKKAATSNQAQAVLVALVSRTGEKIVDRTRDDFEYDDEPDLLFVRRFVLDTILRAYKEASVPGEPFDVRYGRMICLAELMSQMIGERDKDSTPSNQRGTDPGVQKSQTQLKRLMYEKGYLAALTASIADIDLTFPNVKRTIKYILRVLRSLTKTAYLLSQSEVMPVTSTDQENEIGSTSSLSDVDSDREETPDLYRNSTLGMLEPGGGEDFSEDSEEGTDLSIHVMPAIDGGVELTFADDDDMFDDDDQYDEELDYGDDMSQDGEDNPSDDDEELGEMGPIEGLSGEPGVVEVIMGEDDEDEDDEDMDEDDEEDPSDDDGEGELDSDDMEDVEEQIQVVDEEGNPMEDDGADGWEDDTDEEDEQDEDEIDFEAEIQDMHEARMHDFREARTLSPFPGDIRASDIRAAMEADGLNEEQIQAYEDDYDDELDDDGEQRPSRVREICHCANMSR